MMGLKEAIAVRRESVVENLCASWTSARHRTRVGNAFDRGVDDERAGRPWRDNWSNFDRPLRTAYRHGRLVFRQEQEVEALEARGAAR